MMDGYKWCRDGGFHGYIISEFMGLSHLDVYLPFSINYSLNEHSWSPKHYDRVPNNLFSLSSVSVWGAASFRMIPR